MVILKHIGDRSYLESLRVGEIAQNVLRVIIEGGSITGAVTKTDIENFKAESWTYQTFGVQYALLSNRRDIISGSCRYYKEEMNCYGDKLFLTNYWKDSHKDRLIDWILNWVSKNGTPVSASRCDTNCRYVYYNQNVKNGERVAGLCKKLEVEYLEYLYHFARRLFGNLFIDNLPNPVDVVLCKELPTETCHHKDEYIKNKINQLIKNGKTIDLEETINILRHTDYIYGRFFESPKPRIEIYFNQFASPSWDEFFAQISQTLAHEFMHYLVYEYRKLNTKAPIKKKEVDEALADFFGVIYSLKRADDLKAEPLQNESRKLVAAMMYEEWVKWNGTGWPYSYALYFYCVNKSYIAFSYEISEYSNHGSIDKFMAVFESTPHIMTAYNNLINM